MLRRLLLPLVFSVAVALPATAQQSLALAAGPHERDPLWVVQRALVAAVLKPNYVVRLVSNWPQLSAGGIACLNGGQEVLEGRLSQTSGGGYAGLLQRKATIRFCGVHGPAQDACALTLTSQGSVTASGQVAQSGPGWQTPVIELRWYAPEGASEAVVDGDCSAEFSEALRRMYLTVSHSLEFPLPPAGEGRRTTPLDDYGWIVDVQ
jgi:hypothetical protein